MIANIKIIGATVISLTGTDIVILKTDSLPDPVWPYEGNIKLQFEAAHGKGAEYVKNHLGIEPEVITKYGKI